MQGLGRERDKLVMGTTIKEKSEGDTDGNESNFDILLKLRVIIASKLISMKRTFSSLLLPRKDLLSMIILQSSLEVIKWRKVHMKDV